MTKLVRCGINFYADVDNKKAVNDRDALQNTKLMEHYTHLLGQLQYEGAGIWSRFNIMFGINVSLFGLETVLFNSVCQTSEYLTFIIAFGDVYKRQIVASESTGSTFDLYDIGLVFFDKARYKQHYIVNFL